MVLLHQPAMRRLDGLEIRIAVKLQCAQRAHLITATATIPRPSPFPLRRLAEARSSFFFFGSPPRRFLGTQAREIIPILVVFGRVSFAEIQTLPTIRSLGRGAVANFAAAFAVTQTHFRGVAALHIRPPTGKSPIV